MDVQKLINSKCRKALFIKIYLPIKLNSPIWLRYKTTSNSVGDKTLKKIIYQNL